MKRAFSLVELLVVIGIIGILSGVVLGTFSGSTESARAARCLSNMRNLAAACQSAGLETGSYPPASSFEYCELKQQRDGDYAYEFFEKKGWLSWYSEGSYQQENGHAPTSSQAGSPVSMYNSDEAHRDFALTNGVIWKYTGKNRDVYLCPEHAKKMKPLNPFFSYVMNAKMCWDWKKGGGPLCDKDSLHTVLTTYGYLNRADRRLLFAEIPFQGIGCDAPTDEGEMTDSVLQYLNCKECGTPEMIGFNHKSGKIYHAHVVFADGHVEKLVYPKGGLSEGELRDLTKWLCESTDYSFDGTAYEELKE